MNGLTYKGKVTTYLKLPIALVGVFAAGSAFLLYHDFRLGFAAALVTILYGIVVVSLYQRNVRLMGDEMVYFATEYAGIQKEFLDYFQLPYALLDNDGRFLWQNREFSLISGHEKDYSKSITSIFPQITREFLMKQEETAFSMRLTHEDKVYAAMFKRVEFSDSVITEKRFREETGEDSGGHVSLLTIMLLDVTESESIRQENEDQRMVAGLLYIDNYEETIDSVEDVKKSLLIAVMDRKVSRYFRETDAIVRKLEKDKYFIVFQNKYLKRLEEDKFSILEDMKTTKLGNEKEVTVSIGIGCGGGSYQKNAEYARAAIDLAMGRGGSQAVVKENGDISYYGIRGKEVEKNTRVKARVKAQALREIMETRDKVLVMGHAISDVDALGAGIGVYCAARVLGKECHIVLNTITSSLRPVVELFSEEAGYPADLFIENERALALQDSKTLVVVVDTNRPNYTECPRLLERSKSVVVLDHHRRGNERIENPILSYIEPFASSACEMIAEVLQYFSEGIRLSPAEADTIYAGILIDTNNFMTKTGVRTFEAAAYLKRSGAEVTRVRKMLREDMSTYKARAEVVRHARVYRDAFAISICQADELESPTIVGAQAANELLNIVGIKASFVLTEFRNKIFVSSRSIDEIDVQGIMERLGGGGHLNVAGAQIEGSTISEVEERIRDTIDIMIDEGEIEL